MPRGNKTTPTSPTPQETSSEKVSTTDLAMRTRAMNNLTAAEQNYRTAQHVLVIMDQLWAEIYHLAPQDGVDINTGLITRADVKTPTTKE